MSITPLAFMNLLSYDEQTAISRAALQDPAINLWLLKLVAVDTVDPADPQLAQGISAMVSAGLLSQERAAELVAAVVHSKPPTLTVTSSRVEAGVPQADQRFYVTEIFTLSDGSVRTQTILLDPGTDYQLLLAQHAAELNAELAQAAANG